MAHAGPTSRATSTVRLEVVDIDRLHGHERIQPSLLERLTQEIRRDGFLKRPILVADRDYVVLDGHHRLEALRALGCHKIPCYLVDYFSEVVDVDTWPDAEVAHVTKEEIIRRGLCDDPFPPKTSRHKVRSRLADAPTDLEDLM